MPEQDGIAVEVVDEVEDDWQRRQYLKQIYESHKRAREALFELSYSNRGENQKLAVTAVLDLVRVCRPLVQNTELWDGVVFGELEHVDPESNGKQTVSVPVVGVQDLIRYEEGYETVVNEEAPGNTSATVSKVVQRRLPREIVANAYDDLTEFLYDRDILIAETGESEAKDTGAL